MLPPVPNGYTESDSAAYVRDLDEFLENQVTVLTMMKKSGVLSETGYYRHVEQAKRRNSDAIKTYFRAYAEKNFEDVSATWDPATTGHNDVQQKLNNLELKMTCTVKEKVANQGSGDIKTLPLAPRSANSMNPVLPNKSRIEFLPPDHPDNLRNRIKDLTKKDADGEKYEELVFADPAKTTKAINGVVASKCVSDEDPALEVQWVDLRENVRFNGSHLQIIDINKTINFDCLDENRGGFEETDMAVFMTGPGTAPENIEITANKPNTISVQFEIPSIRNGKIIKCIIYYIPLPDPDHQLGQIQTTPINKWHSVHYLNDGVEGPRKMDISDFVNPDTVYAVVLQAINNHSPGPFSNKYTIRTISRALEALPIELRVDPDGQRSALVQWKRPATFDVPPIGYEIYYVRSDKSVEEDDSAGLTNWMKISIDDPSVLTHTIRNLLLLDTDYVFKIRAIFPDGPGVFSNPCLMKTRPDENSRHIQNSTEDDRVEESATTRILPDDSVCSSPLFLPCATENSTNCGHAVSQIKELFSQWKTVSMTATSRDAAIRKEFSHLATSHMKFANNWIRQLLVLEMELESARKSGSTFVDVITVVMSRTQVELELYFDWTRKDAYNQLFKQLLEESLITVKIGEALPAIVSLLPDKDTQNNDSGYDIQELKSKCTALNESMLTRNAVMREWRKSISEMAETIELLSGQDDTEVLTLLKSQRLHAWRMTHGYELITEQIKSCTDSFLSI